MKNILKKSFIIFIVLLSILILSVIGAYIFRQTILDQAISKIENKFKTDYNADFSIQKATFIDLSSVELNKIVLVPAQADTLLSIENIKTKINIYQIISGNIQIEKLELKNGFIQLVKNENGKNFSAFLKSNSKEDSDNSEQIDYAEFSNNLINKLTNLVPESITLENVALKISDMGKKVSLKTDKLTLKNQQFRTLIYVETNTFSQVWTVSGKADPRLKIADIVIKNNDTTKIKLPYIDEKFKLVSSFDNLHFKIDKIEMESGDLHIDGMTSVDNLTLNNPKIANKDVVFKKSKFDFKFLISSRSVAVDSGSVIALNDIKLHPFIECNTEKDVIYSFKANINKMKAQDFINSLPTGLFPHFEGMLVNGNFGYNINIKFNKNKPWQLTFNSNLQRENLNIIKYGTADLEKLNTDFIYNAIDNGQQQRPIDVSLLNPNYASLDQISPYLQKCVLTCEDPSFMSHKGFINEAFRQSILKNMRTNKFSRGASTISMQLIKNVFLTREKTISRKLEEILLVYILENNRIATKERMLEVYFNIIEWGPDVYGIGEAAQFYFQKKPIDLSLKECLFLASIVPSPKKFMNNFDASGMIKSLANKRQEFIKNIMQKRGLITFDSISQSNNLIITGAARKFLNLKQLDSTKIDSLNIDEF